MGLLNYLSMDGDAIGRQIPSFATSHHWDIWRKEAGDGEVCRTMIMWGMDLTKKGAHARYDSGIAYADQLKRVLEKGGNVDEARKRMGEFFEQQAVDSETDGYVFGPALARIGADIARDRHQTHAPNANVAAAAVDQLLTSPPAPAA